MKINFIVSRSMNQFFFIQNLSEWHFSCRKNYNKDWLELTGPLNKEEIKSLVALKRTLQKYDFERLEKSKAQNIFDYLLRYDTFIGEGDILKESELQTYQEAMNILKPRFEIIWNQQNKNFSRVQKELTEKFNLTEEQIKKDLKVLFKGADLSEEINIILLLSTGERGGGGGANNGPNIITLECSSLDEKYIPYELFIIWHEIAHKVLREYTDKLIKVLEGNQIIMQASREAEKINFNYVKELFVYSLFTDMSYLTCRYFPTEICPILDKAVESDDSERLCNSKKTFPIYLIYLNGQFIKARLESTKEISVQDMADEIVKNHELTEKYFKGHNKKVVWFFYN